MYHLWNGGLSLSAREQVSVVCTYYMPVPSVLNFEQQTLSFSYSLHGNSESLSGQNLLFYIPARECNS